jgi:plasmid stabilization system protein ParE
VKRSLRIQPLAEEDIQQAYDCYQEHRDGLGDELLDNLQSCFDRIEANPLQFPVVARDVRRVLVHRFPYCVYFIVTANTLDVLAVLHAKRDAEAWEKRIGSIRRT